MALPEPFTTTQQQVVTYDWSDITAGVSYRNFYPAETEDGKVLYSQTTLYATNFKEFSIATNTAFDEDFDILINEPITINGDVIVTFAVIFKNNTASNPTTISSDLTVKIRKWDGTTETDLGTATVTASAIIGNTAPNNVTEYTYSFSINVLNQFIPSGSTLRYSIIGTSTLDAAKLLYIGRDPANRSSATIFDPNSSADTTRTTVSVPIKNTN